jgi:hypothetical protein
MRLKKTAMPTDPADLATWVVVAELVETFIVATFQTDLRLVRLTALF